MAGSILAQRAVAAASIVLVLLFLVRAAQGQAAFYVIDPAPDRTLTVFQAAARNGNAMTGVSNGGSSGPNIVFRWTPGNGREDITAIPGNTAAYGISPTGSTLIGPHAVSPNSMFLWDAGDGYRTIGLPAGRAFETQFTGPSAWTADDGSWAIATFQGSGSDRKPYRWTPSTGWVTMGGPNLVTRVSDVSPDGTVMVGTAQDFNTGSSFIWRQGQGYTEFDPTLLAPLAVNDSGTAIVGYRSVPSSLNTMAVVRINDTYTDLGTLPGYTSSGAADISNDGSFIVGTSHTPGAGTPVKGFVWTSASGMRSLDEYMLTEYGLTFPADASVRSIAINSDGTMISGTLDGFGFRNAFALTIPAPGILSVCLGSVIVLRRRRR